MCDSLAQYIAFNISLSQEDARAYCNSQGLTIARVDSEADQQAILDAIDLLPSDYPYGYYIGLNDRDNEVRFRYRHATYCRSNKVIPKLITRYRAYNF